MPKNFVQSGVGVALACAAAAFGPMTVGAAFAADFAPHVDMSQPHLQEYPDSAQLNGEQGAVLVDVYVRPNGRPSKIRVAQSSGFQDLDNAAVESVLNWRFTPAVRDGDLVSDWTTVKVVYQLPSAPATPQAQ